MAVEQTSAPTGSAFFTTAVAVATHVGEVFRLPRNNSGARVIIQAGCYNVADAANRFTWNYMACWYRTNAGLIQEQGTPALDDQEAEGAGVPAMAIDVDGDVGFLTFTGVAAETRQFFGRWWVDHF